jgi:hypothetical protein
MKRSAQIGLVVMGTLTTTSAASYFAYNHEQTCQARAADNLQQQPQPDCRRSVWHGWGHSSGGSHAFFGSSSSSASSNGASGHSSSGTGSAARGGFGGHGGGGHGGGS